MLLFNSNVIINFRKCIYIPLFFSPLVLHDVPYVFILDRQPIAPYIFCTLSQYILQHWSCILHQTQCPIYYVTVKGRPTVLRSTSAFQTQNLHPKGCHCYYCGPLKVGKQLLSKYLDIRCRFYLHMCA